MDLNREKLADALENAIRTVVPLEGVVKMSGGVAQMVVEAIRGPGWIDAAEQPPRLNGIRYGDHNELEESAQCLVWAENPDGECGYGLASYVVDYEDHRGDGWAGSCGMFDICSCRVLYWMSPPKAPDATPTGRAGQCPAPTEATP